MKTFNSYLVLTIALATININAADNKVANAVVRTATDEVKSVLTNAQAGFVAAANSETVAVAKTNLNSIMIDILSGVRDVGKDIYGASKDAIRSSVTFAQEQAPLVVKEFLMWHMARAILYGLSFVVGALVCYLTARWIRKHVIADEEFSEGWIPLVLLRLTAGALIVFGAGGQLMTVTQIAVAPKVYIIEYVVDTIQGGHRTPQTR